MHEIVRKATLIPPQYTTVEHTYCHHYQRGP